ncbi:zinc-binding dehydrogenase [Yinghuangia aomiensis]
MVREFGPPSVLTTEKVDAPRPEAGQVLVAVELAGVVFGDTIVRSGRHPFPLPYIPGLEIGGRIVGTGQGVDAAMEGRTVVATTPQMCGGYASLALADATSVHPVPAGLPLAQAVATFQAGAVSLGILAAMGVSPGDSVLVTAAAGRIGSLLVQLAKAKGATVVAGVGSTEKALAAASFGADTVVDYSDGDWVGQVRAATDNRGVDVVLDAIGGTVGAQALDAAADGLGRIGIYGFASGSWTKLNAYTIGRRGLTVVGPLGIAFAQPEATQHAAAEQALRHAAAGELAARIHAFYALEQAAAAHTAIENRQTVGAVLLRP